MTREELLGRRWGAVLPSETQSVEAAVARLGAVQAQDFNMSLLAAGLRSPGAASADVEAALSAGVVRTHVMRPTWHLVAAQDLRWMMELTANRVLMAAGHQFRTLGLTPEIRAQARGLIERALKDGPLSREELMTAVAEDGLSIEDIRPAHYMMDAEMALLVCNGPRRGKTHTYDLVDRRIPAAAPLPRDEAVARLTLRYLRGHGPATERDLSWWSGLGLTDVRLGLNANRPLLATATFGESEVWFDPEGAVASFAGFRWLPAYDEALVAFADRSAVLDGANVDAVLTRNGIFNPIVVYDGRICGTWKKVVKGKTLEVEVLWFSTPPGAEESRLKWKEFLTAFV